MLSTDRFVTCTATMIPMANVIMPAIVDRSEPQKAGQAMENDNMGNAIVQRVDAIPITRGAVSLSRARSWSLTSCTCMVVRMTPESMSSLACLRQGTVGPPSLQATCRAPFVESVCRCYNHVSENKVLFSAAEIVVHPCQAKQQHALFPCPQAGKDFYQTWRDSAKQQAPGLRCRDPTNG